MARGAFHPKIGSSSEWMSSMRRNCWYSTTPGVQNTFTQKGIWS